MEKEVRKRYAYLKGTQNSKLCENFDHLRGRASQVLTGHQKHQNGINF
jgi:hypothetical protein